MRRRGKVGEHAIEAMLGPLAGSVMRIVLRTGTVTVRDVSEALATQRSPAPAYTTVMTIMSRLHERGLLERERRGRGFLYRATADEQKTIDNLSRRAVDRLLSTYGTAAMRQFAVHLSELDDGLREELLALARSPKRTR